MIKSYLSWSSGKDAAYTLHLLHERKQLPDLVLTTLSEKEQRVSMHGLRRNLLEAQQEALPVASRTAAFESNASMDSYESFMRQLHTSLKQQGFDMAIFGDINLEDLRKYREQQLKKMEFTAAFPLWGKNTGVLAQEIINEGIKAITVCINADLLPKSLLGHPYDESFLRKLPPNVDPCGENGEFHTFCYNAPYFKAPVSFTKGDVVHKSFPYPSKKNQKITFSYLDLLPANNGSVP